MGYTRAQIYNRLNEMSADMSSFYNKGCINYRGKTAYSKEYYSDYKWLEWAL